MSKKTGCTLLFISEIFDEWRLLKLILEGERNDEVITCIPDFHKIQSVVEREQVDLVLLTFVIDKRDSFLLYQQLRSIPSLRETPVLFWRVPRPKAVYSQAQQFGIAGCIHYIFQPQDLLAARDAVLAGGTYYPPP